MKSLLLNIAAVLLMFRAAFTAAEPPIVPLERLVIRSAGAVEAEAIRALLPDTLRGPGGRDTLDKVQRALHAERGYYASRLSEYATATRGSETVLRAAIESGPLIRLGEAHLISPVPLDDERWRGIVARNRGKAATAPRVRALMEQTVLAYADIGYPFCRVDLREAEPDHAGSLRPVLAAEPGNRRLVGNVAFPGLEHTRESVALRLAGLVPGEFYSETRVRRARGRLMRSGLFRRVDEPLVSDGTGPYRADLRYDVEEARSNSLLAALGSGGPTGASTVSGLFRLEMNNLLGTARRAGVRWERPRRDWSELEVAWREPWLMGRRVSLEASYGQQLRDSLYSASAGKLGLTVESGDFARLGLGAVIERVDPGSETWELAQSSSRWSVEGSIECSDFLHPVNPVRGSRITARAQAGRRKISGESLREVRADMSLEMVLPLVRSPHTAAISAGYSFVSRGSSGPTDLPYHSRIPVGGSHVSGGILVRGHPDETLRARRAGLLSLEYRYLTGPDSRLFLFYDLCAAQTPASPERAAAPVGTEGWRVRTLQGYGAGIRLESRLGLLGLSFAMQPGRGPGDARLHVSLIESF